MNTTQQKLGRYLLLGEIAQGGMAVIYRAKLLGAAGFEKSVAIKKILPFWSQNAEFIGMLIDEAKILVELHHPNIVQVFELGQEGDTYFIAMEYVNGFDLRTLGKSLSDKGLRLPNELIAFIAKQICLGLDFAHNKTDALGRPLQLIHRDISPQNVLVGSQGEVKITDFGIAKTTQKTTQTQTGVVKGKFSYMSPEQVLGEEIDQQSDLFALGVLLYEMVCGRKGFDGKNDFEIIEKVKRAEIAWPDSLAPELQTILQRALAVKKSARYADALSFLNDLDAWENTLTKKAQARDLKAFLQEHFADQFQKNAEVSFAPLFNAATVVDTPTRIESNASEATLVTQKTRLNPPKPDSQKTRILLADSAPKPMPPELGQKRPRFKTSTVISIFGSALLLAGFWWGLTPAPQPSAPPTEPVRLEVPVEITPQIVEPINVPDTPPAVVGPPAPEIVTHAGRLTLTTTPATAKITVIANGQTEITQGTFDKRFEFTTDTLPILATIEAINHKPQTLELTLTAQTPELQNNITLQPVEYGSVTVSSRPWANFRIEGFSGKSYGTPGSVKLPVGRYTLHVNAPSLGKSTSKTITIQPNRTLSCRAAFTETATLSCTY